MKIQPSSIPVLLFFLLTGLSLAGCSSEMPEPDETVSVQWGEEQMERPLDDHLSYLGQLQNIKFTGDSRFLTIDDKPSISLFEDHAQTRIIGSEGQGPCEYSGINATDVRGDTLFVLSTGQNKIIRYQISSGDCLGETGSDHLSGIRTLLRSENSYYLGQTNFNAGAADSTHLIHNLSDDGTITSVGLTLGDIDPQQLPLMFAIPGHNFSRNNNRIYLYLHKTTSVVSIDITNNSWSVLPVNIDLRREEMEAAGNSLERVFEIMQNGYEIVNWIHAAPDWLALLYGVNPVIDSRDAEYYLQFYSYGGNFLGELKSDTRLYGYHDGSFFGIRENEDPDASHAYNIIYKKVQLN